MKRRRIDRGPTGYDGIALFSADREGTPPFPAQTHAIRHPLTREMYDQLIARWREELFGRTT